MNKEIQNKMMQLEYMGQQTKALQAQLEGVLKATEELNVLLVGLDNIAETEKGSDMLVPLGASVYVDATIKHTKKVLVGVGAGIFSYKPIKEAKPLVQEQMDALKKQEELIMQNLNMLSQESSTINNELNKLSQENQNAGLS
ncbi:MAG: prefoldin subunit alpha [Candidatus Altiarchaeota archaeon]|nr:prefoldin subunit alpha [Candidatus Altiarchaeota archaeon]